MKKKMDDIIWHKGVGKNMRGENFNLCGNQGPAIFGSNKGVTCNRCRTKLHLRKLSVPEEKYTFHSNASSAEQEDRAMACVIKRNGTIVVSGNGKEAHDFLRRVIKIPAGVATLLSDVEDSIASKVTINGRRLAERLRQLLAR